MVKTGPVSVTLAKERLEECQSWTQHNRDDGARERRAQVQHGEGPLGQQRATPRWNPNS